MDEDSQSIINVRITRGVDLNAAARLSDPGTYKKTQNLWARQRGLLELRPGSSLVAAYVSPIQWPPTSGDNGILAFPAMPMPTVSWMTALAANRTSAALLKSLSGKIPTGAALFSNTLVASTSAIQLNQPNLQNLFGAGFSTSLASTNNGWYIEALEYAYVPYAGVSALFGIMSNQSSDYPFFVDSSGNINPIPGRLDGTSPVSSAAAQWMMQVMAQGVLTDQAGNPTAQNPWMIVCVNGMDPPMSIQTNYSDTNASPSQPYFLKALSMTIAGPSSSTLYMVGPTCFCVYGNQVVWGGPKFSAQAGGMVSGARYRLDNYICFSDPTDPNLAGGTQTGITTLSIDPNNSNNLLTLQIGDTQDEYVTAVSGSTAITDGFGPQGQLSAFTAKKVLLYGGPLPSTGNPAPSGFGQVGDGDMGCVSPKSVVRTKYGVVFLGSDGLVRLISLYNRVEIIGRAIEPLVGGLSQQFYSRCCAYYSRGFYHIVFPFSIQQSFGCLPVGQPGPNSQEWVVDLRSLNLGDPHDCGCEWFGPWTGRYFSCFKAVYSPVDNFPIYAGLGTRAAVIQTEQYGLFTDVNMDNLSASIVYPWSAQTGDLDLGDIHEDKIITAFSLGVAGQNTNSVLASLAASSDGYQGSNISGVGYSATKSVPPSTAAFGIFQWDNSGFTAPGNPALPTWQPPNPVRGRSFIASFTGTPTVGAPLAISDFQFRVKRIIRRSTSY